MLSILENRACMIPSKNLGDPVDMVRAECKSFRVIGVALIFCLLFFVMVAIDKALDFIGEMCTKCCGRKNRQNEVDPAELVGSFKRYKN
uniref:Uncharacterized protein n=1 Tax=Lepeophtheirus salmonis TaxID=72036 RepID=A0A0K2T3S2_LEPSM